MSRFSKNQSIHLLSIKSLPCCYGFHIEIRSLLSLEVLLSRCIFSTHNLELFTMNRIPGASLNASQVLLLTPPQTAIFRNCSYQDYENLCAAYPSFPRLSDRMCLRLFSRPCQETIPATTTHPWHFCTQDNDAPDPHFVAVRKCEGVMTYNNNAIEPQLHRPTGDWPAPANLRIHNPHNVNPGLITDHYVCQTCIDRDIARRWTILHRTMQTYCQPNHCKTHNALFNFDRTTRPRRDCSCRAILTARWNCRFCRNAPDAMLEARGRKWYVQLKKTHRRGVRGRNQTLSTYIDNDQPWRVKPACPVEGCGRTPQTNGNDPLLMKTCLGCCGVFRANPPSDYPSSVIPSSAKPARAKRTRAQPTGAQPTRVQPSRAKARRS